MVTSGTTSIGAKSGRTVVHPSAIQAELERIRREAAAMDVVIEGSGDAAPRVRATLSNFIVLVPRATATIHRELDSLITELCITYPSRFFIVEYLSEASEQSVLETGVSSRCVLTNAGMHVCSEEVYLTVRPQTVPFVKSMLLSLLIPDIEVVLFVLGDLGVLSEGDDLATIIQQIASCADLVVYDSQRFEAYGSTTESLLGAMSKFVLWNGDTLPRRDMHWNRLKRWRTVLAEQFKSEESSNLLERLTRIDLRYGQAGAADSADTLLLASWIASCLSLTPTSIERNATSSVLQFSGPNGQSVSLACSQHEGCTSGLHSLELHLGSGEGEITTILQQHASENALSVTTEFAAQASGSKNSCDLFMRKVPFAPEPFEQVLLGSLGPAARDEAYVASRDLSVVLGKLLRQ